MKEEVADLKIRMAVAESKIDKIETNIEKILSNTAWIIRTILGAIIATILAILYGGGI